MIEKIGKLLRVAKDKGPEINECKTKYVVLNVQQKGRDANLVVSAVNGKHHNFERVGKFNYLGVTLTDNGREEIKILERLTKGTKYMRILRAKNISKKTKLSIYKTIILYGRELWKTNQREKGALEIWERKVLGKIFGAKKEGDHWERRTNNELVQVYGESPTTTVIRTTQRLRWLGHL